MDRSFSAQGLYLLHPSYGMLGIGAVEYDSKRPGDDELAALQKQLETLRAVLFALVAKLHENATKKGTAF